jgi:hypothetical protein
VRLEPGKAAVVALAGDWSTLQGQGAIETYEGPLIVQVLDEETVKELFKTAGSES